ncbi:MAG: DUF1559 domain-containing protein, partial [Planctomycetes bacterium]|nr:DUF1559 domain-containing protein [Planctomycetota bacterium]
RPLLSWRVALLPYLEEQTLYSQFHLDEPWDSPHNRPLLENMPKVYRNLGDAPTDPHSTFYQVFVGKGTPFEDPKGLTLGAIDRADGTSNTLLVVEAGQAVPWTQPMDLPYAADQPLPPLGGIFKERFRFSKSSQAKYFRLLMVDASGRIFPKDGDERTLRALITWNGGEKVEW